MKFQPATMIISGQSINKSSNIFAGVAMLVYNMRNDDIIIACVNFPIIYALKLTI